MKQTKKSIHLICNAHLDPVWLWKRDEGIAEALSTFRTAADFCEEYENFVFCHNEVILYEWVEQYEPSLFKRIQKLVKDGRWNIMGGWYLQPDCNMISGESVIRQIKLGKEYFVKKFGVYPKTAVNFDPFGHSKGLVQILTKAGFESYLFMRPAPERCKLPANIFRWQGYDGSEVVGHRLFGAYMTLRGTAVPKLKDFIAEGLEHDASMLAWGIGNHGGGPSRCDLEGLNECIKEYSELDVKHSSPDDFFKELKESGAELPVHDKEMNFFATGCYTSQVRIKQQHRKLEADLNLTEKLLSAAWLKAGYEYPYEKLREAGVDLAFSEFHDVLPGSSIKPVEEESLQQISHGREILSRLRTGAFFSMLQGQKKAKDGDIPLFVWNPHPYPVSATIECEMQLADQNHNESFMDIEVFDNGRKIVSQVEHEDSNLNLDWRKKVVFQAELPPGSISRYECSPKEVSISETPVAKTIKDKIFAFNNGELSVKINTSTGFIDSFKVNSKELVRPGSGRVIVMQDDSDPWGCATRSYKKRIGSFRLMKRAEVADFTSFKIDPVRIIEDGKVRTVLEALFKYERSTMRVRYYLPKNGTDIEIRMQINNQQVNCMYKMSWLFADKQAECVAQDIFGRKEIPGAREEKVFSQWFAASSESHDAALALICDSGHGLDFYQGEMRYSLLRSPCYSALPTGKEPLVSEDRAHDHIDMGQRDFSFKIYGGGRNELLSKIDKETMSFSEAPPTILFYPGGKGNKISSESPVKLSDSPAVMTCFRRSSEGESLIVRIFNPTADIVKTELSVMEKINSEIELEKFQIKTFKIDLSTNKIAEIQGIE